MTVPAVPETKVLKFQELTPEQKELIRAPLPRAQPILKLIYSFTSATGRDSTPLLDRFMPSSGVHRKRANG